MPFKSWARGSVPPSVCPEEPLSLSKGLSQDERMWIHSSAWLPILVGEHVATADMVGRTDQPFLLHPLDQARGAVISDAQLPLQPARRGLLAFGDDLAGLRIHAVFGAVAAGGGALHRKAAVLGVLGDAVDIVGAALTLPVIGDRAPLVVGRSEEHKS